ncbi:MAG: EscU/YscU/HrcU family type III secretion system export apparatus switch protein [Candidatus Polarisedimenticolaceae bacterium]|nr:EscU/YscU/HrcU family type III secretion system export apparatus switch protein [Candidatus Polarisedimenticolaceae bacterium]
MSTKDSEQESLAIALYYDEKNAPRVTAKGEGAIARQIMALAEEHNIPLEDDPELAALLAQIPLGDEIPEALYLAIAEVIAFAYIVAGKFPAGYDSREG